MRKIIYNSGQLLFRLALAGILILAGYLKLQDNTALFETIAYITWIPVWIKSLIVDWLPWIEIVVGGLLLTRFIDKTVITIVLLIFTGFLGFAIYGFATGLEGDCGCFGELSDSTFGWSMIIRNAVFVAMAGFLFWRPEEERAPF
ncbi:MAG: MauE/DoxX family redox-associated membrane protein [Balneolaceae bacterium]